MALKVLDKNIGRGARNINYLGRDFVSFRQNLMEYAKTYFPNTYNDFNETSPGMMFIEMAAYVGDVLSYYTDSALKESLIQYASEPSNVYALAQMLGYKPKVTSPAVTTLSAYQLCKADSDGNLDAKYLIKVQAGMQVTSKTNSEIVFRTTDDLDFNDPSNRDITVYSVNQLTKKPDYFLVKKPIRAISAIEKTIDVTIGSPKAYYSITIDDTNVIQIESIVDSNGNTWYEVPYLAQEMVYIDYPNVPEYDPDLAQFRNTVPYILQLIKTSKRFTTRVNADFTTEIMFGGGDSSYSNELITPTIKNVGLGLNNSIDTLNQSYDPTNFLKTNTYGEAPANTVLTIKYLVGGGVTSNAQSEDLTVLTGVVYLESGNETQANFDQTLYQFAKASLAVENEQAAIGGKDADTIDEVRENALANFGSQNRAVTGKDYQIRALSLPAKYGSVAKAYAIADSALNPYTPSGILNSQTNLNAFTELVKQLVDLNQENGSLTTSDIKNYIDEFVSTNSNNAELLNPYAVNLYTTGYDSNGNFTPLNRAVKENLKTYLNEYRILTDSVNIIDAYIINIGIDFDITVYRNYNSREVVLNCIAELNDMFINDNMQINQPIYLSDIELRLASIDGVASVQSVNIYNLCGGKYSNVNYNIKEATKNKVIYPSLDPSIFEVKFPNTDIKGRAV